LLELTKIFCCEEYQKPEEGHRNDIRQHAGGGFGSWRGSFEFRKVKQANDIVALPGIIDRISTSF
jgi:hypothetical protein